MSSVIPPISSVDPRPGTVSMADRVRAKLEAQLKPKPITLCVPAMPGMEVTYSHQVEPDDTIKYAKQAGIDPEGDSVEGIERMYAYLLVETCMAIIVDGEVWRDAEGQPVTFKRKALHELVGTDVHADAVMAFYGSKGDVIASGSLVVENSGLGGSRVRPTTPPSTLS